MAGGVLEEHGHETLQGAERGAVDHHRTLAGAVGIDILQLEALGEVVVHLDGAQLPAAADGVLHHEVQLRAVEGGFARLHDERQALLLRGLDDAGLGLLPVLVGTDVLGRVLGVAEGDLRGELVEVQGLEDVQDQVDDLLELLLDLVLAAEQVRIVLGESADAGQAVQLTGLLVAVHGAELGVAQGQVLVGVRGAAVDLAVVGAVHGLEHELLAFLRGMDGLEGILAVLGVVAGGHIEFLAADMRGDDLQIAVFGLLLPEEVLQGVAERRALREPQGQARAHALGEGEEFHLLADLAVVALLGLLEHHQVFVQHGLLGEGDAVDAGELLAGLVTAPVGAGEGEHLDGLDDLGVAQVRAAAQVRELAVGVVCDGTVFQLGNELLLVLVALFGEVGQGFGLGDVDAAEVLLLAGEFQHLVLDGLEVGVRQGAAVHVHVVVETVLDGGADAELDAREKGFEGLGHEVGGGVPEHFLGLVVIPFEQAELHVLVDGTEQVDGGSLGSLGLAGLLH